MSWIRKRDLHIMTIGILTYTNDQRYQAIHTEGSDEWSLRVTSPQPRDSGVYECQVSTEPKISQAYRLNVVGKFKSVKNCFASIKFKVNNAKYLAASSADLFTCCLQLKAISSEIV